MDTGQRTAPVLGNLSPAKSLFSKITKESQRHRIACQSTNKQWFARPVPAPNQSAAIAFGSGRGKPVLCIRSEWVDVPYSVFSVGTWASSSSRKGRCSISGAVRGCVNLSLSRGWGVPVNDQSLTGGEEGGGGAAQAVHFARRRWSLGFVGSSRTLPRTDKIYSLQDRELQFSFPVDEFPPT